LLNTFKICGIDMEQYLQKTRKIRTILQLIALFSGLLTITFTIMQQAWVMLCVGIFICVITMLIVYMHEHHLQHQIKDRLQNKGELT